MNAYGGYLEYAFRYHVNTTMPFENLQKSYLANYDIIIEVITIISCIFWIKNVILVNITGNCDGCGVYFDQSLEEHPSLGSWTWAIVTATIANELYYE